MVKGLDSHELSKILPLMKAVREFNPVEEGDAGDGVFAEVALWRAGREVAVITEAEGGGLRLISRESTDV